MIYLEQKLLSVQTGNIDSVNLNSMSSPQKFVFIPQETKLRKIEPNMHLKISLSIIYYMGTWPQQGKYRYVYMLYTMCSFIFMLGILIMSEIANFVVHWGDMAKLIAGATVLMTNCAHTYKMTVILFRQKRIQALLDFTKNKMFNQDNITRERILTHYTWGAIFHHIAYQSFGATAVFCWGFRPIADLLAGRSRELPTVGWYPYNVTTTPNFEITSSHQAVAVVIACFHDVAMDTLVTGLITVACCQLTLLNRHIASIGNEINEDAILKENPGSKSIRMNRKPPYEDLKTCIEHTNMIFDFSKEIQDVFGSAIFLQFFVNCIIICLIAFNITQMKVYIPSVLVGMMTYMCCMTYQIFIYCWHGNELYLHSMNVVSAVYWSNWWNGSKRFKKGIKIMMIRAQRPIALTAGNVMSLSLETFVEILRLSYSIFTVLQSSMNN